MPSLVESFVAGLRAEVRGRFDGAALAATLAAHVAAGTSAWPEVTVDPARFAGDLARRLGDDATPVALERACGADVYLAVACIDADAAAVAAVDALCEREVGIVAAKLRATKDQAAEVKANLVRVLVVDEQERAAALRSYSGRGNLRAYVRVIATRDLIRSINVGRREAPPENDDILERLATLHDPELSVLRARYHQVVGEAMRAAIAGLDTRTRALLRYQIVDGWTVEQVGKVYGVHKATAARWLVAARESLASAIQDELVERLDVEADEVASIIRIVQSRVDVSLERLLARSES